MTQSIKDMLLESSSVLKQTAELEPQIEQAAELVITAIKNGNKILLIGNGGSATQASHIAAEFTGRYKKERKGLPAIALTTDIAAVTAISNDYGYERVYSRQVEALGKEGDVLISLSTSGNSKNIINANSQAKKQGIKVINLIGKEGGGQKGGDVDIIVASNNTPRIQEAHIAILHIICEIMENRLFP